LVQRGRTFLTGVYKDTLPPVPWNRKTPRK